MAAAINIRLVGVLSLVCFVSYVSTSSLGASNESRPVSQWEDRKDGGLHVAYIMVNFFLEQIVQSRQLDYMEEKGVDFTSFNNIKESFVQQWKDWTLYFIGFAVCLALGLVTMLIMLVAGPCVACCRCCGNCGGKIEKQEGKNAGCARGCLSFWLLLMVIILFFGSGCMIHAALRYNDKLSGTHTVFSSVSNGIRTVGSFAQNSTEEIRQEAVGTFSTTAENVIQTVSEVPEKTVDRFDAATGLGSNVAYLVDFANSLNSVHGNLTKLNDSSLQLSSLHTTYKPQLEELKANATDELERCNQTHVCNQTLKVARGLVTNIDYTHITLAVSVAVVPVEKAADLEIGEKFQQAYRQIDNIISSINNTLQEKLGKIRNETNNIKNAINTEVDKVKDQINQANFSEIATTVENVAEEKHVKLGFNITYIVTLTVPAVLGFTALLYLFGMLLGVICDRPGPRSTQCCTRAAGAHFLLAGVAFTFIFYWIYIIFTVTFFTAGGVTHTEACRHLTSLIDNEVTPSMRVLDKLATTSIGESSESGNKYNISVVNFIQQCYNDSALYTALALEENGILNITSITSLDRYPQLRQTLENLKKVQLEIPKIDVLPDLSIVEATNRTENALKMVNYTDISNTLTTNWTTVSLDIFAHQLRQAANETDNDNLHSLADTAIKLHANIISSNVFGLRASALKYTENLQSFTMSLRVSQTIENILKANETLNVLIEGEAKSAINTTADNVYDQLQNSSTAIANAVKYSIARCRPLHTAVRQVADATCRATLWPINAYWFAMGWCVFFLIPAFILALKLVTLLRKEYAYREIAEYDNQLYTDGYSGPGAEPYNHQPEDMALHPMSRQPVDYGGQGYTNQAYMLDGGKPYKIPRAYPRVLPSEPPPKYSHSDMKTSRM